MKDQPEPCYEFGLCRLDIGQSRFWRGDQEIALRPMIVTLLRLLIENRGRVVDKNEIYRKLWTDRIVEEGAIPVMINELRAGLGEGGYIQTVPKRGYRFVADVKTTYAAAQPIPVTSTFPDSPGGGVLLNSPFYITRPADNAFCAAITKGDSIVLVKGARQVGKTSLLARGLQEARNQGALVLLVDFQQLNSAALQTIENVLRAVAELIACELDLSRQLNDLWSPLLGPSSNFEQFFKREVLKDSSRHVVWGLDEIDRLFNFPYASEIFGLFRSWHNRRSLDPNGPLSRLTMAMAYATEAHLFITDLNQSPFNVGTRLALDDFTFDQVMDLNGRYGNLLSDPDQATRFFRLLNGHPYLTQRGLYEMAVHHVTIDSMEEYADCDQGIFGGHLRRLFVSLEQEQNLLEELRQFLLLGAKLSDTAISRLRSAGIISGDLSAEPSLRCELYIRYLKRRLS